MVESIESKVAKLLHITTNFYWSPLHPDSYVIPAPDGKVMGIGLVANKDYAAFNLAWGMVWGKWQTHREQSELIEAFVIMQCYTGVQIGGAPLGDWLTLIAPAAVPKLMTSAGNHLTASMKEVVLGAAAKAHYMQVNR